MQVLTALSPLLAGRTFSLLPTKASVPKERKPSAMNSCAILAATSTSSSASQRPYEFPMEESDEGRYRRETVCTGIEGFVFSREPDHQSAAQNGKGSYFARAANRLRSPLERNRGTN